MDIRKLRYFVGVAEAGSFTRAAETLHVAQSALSLHVRQIEEEFNVQLLTRDRNGVQLTLAGHGLLRHARRILDQIQIMENDLRNAGRTVSGEVTIAIPAGPASFLTPALIAAAREKFPLISLRILEGMSGAIQDWLATGRLDIAILYKTREEAAGMDVLAEEEFCLILPPDAPPEVETVRISELYKFPVVVPMDVNNVRRSVGETVARHGPALNIQYQMDSISSIISLVSSGKAYSILTPSTVQREIASGQLRAARITDPPILCAAVVSAFPKREHATEVVAIRDLLPGVVNDLIDAGVWAARRGATG